MKNGVEVIEPEEHVSIKEILDELTKKTPVIIVYNDDHNTFPHVITCLVKYCGHTMEQAEQCATIIHHNGKTDVKRGDLKKLKPIKEALCENGLNAKIEE